MRDLDKALADILAIRNQIAAGTAFRGLWARARSRQPRGVALITAFLQFLLLDDPTAHPLPFCSAGRLPPSCRRR